MRVFFYIILSYCHRLQNSLIYNNLQATTTNNPKLNNVMSEESIEKRQVAMDAEYTKEYLKWFADLDAATKEAMKKKGLHKPDARRRVSKGSFENEMLDNQKAPPLVPFEELEIVPEGVDGKAERIALRAIRVALSDICNPRPGHTAAFEASIVGLAIGVMGMVSISHQARLHGVGRAAVSKRCVSYCDDAGLSPSVYMRSVANRETHRLANVRGRKVGNE